MAYPNFKNGPKTGLCPLGVKTTIFCCRGRLLLKIKTSKAYLSMKEIVE
jgi:hypothetical protein